MWLLPFVVSSCLFLMIAPSCCPQREESQARNESSEALAIQLVKPPQWEEGCLSISLDRINRSSVPLFLPEMGLYISTSVDELRDAASEKAEQKWINAYGATDIFSWEATPFASGTTVHTEVCLPPSVFVVNMEKKTRRGIPLRGRLGIDAYYFLTEKDWRKYKSYHEEMLQTKPNEWDKLVRQDPSVVTTFAAIPCRGLGCKSNCDLPPLIVHGETRIVPDVVKVFDWEARGKEISDELAGKFPDCSEAKRTPR